MALVYLDTSALAKWYLNEAHSHEFSNWIQKQEDTHISSLTITEFRCLLARRRRNRASVGWVERKRNPPSC
ncbi:type II toxin-antitoxin system VapC family toxin [Candidatus Parabeggiatoa sp. HSG14]|uniref:type II toxin-antitoxin system VapC family toxin n=1 Tax=Candidatus Parabeggiatoa sp. HSG14 TaxID=3055593 RepID=UPI0025A8F664|nr:type II toxin-antitoxin system VapC family toxin [Thiotrichales bacterium HSG14]